MKDFHKFFAYYGKSKPKEVEYQENYILKFHIMWC